MLVACGKEGPPPPGLELEKLAGSHILIQHEESRGDGTRSREEALELARALSERAKAGEDFAALAREYSDDVSTRDRGGNLGSFRTDRYVAAIARGMLQLQFGEVSEPIESVYGYHVLRRRPVQFYGARHILVQHVDATAVPDSVTRSREDALVRIREIDAMLKEGEDFAGVAREYSEGRERAKGGDLEIFSEGELVEPFERAVAALEVGERSGIVETIYGFHIILRTE